MHVKECFFCLSHLREQLLLDRVHELRPEVPRVEHDLVLKADMVEHDDGRESLNAPKGLVGLHHMVDIAGGTAASTKEDR